EYAMDLERHIVLITIEGVDFTFTQHEQMGKLRHLSHYDSVIFSHKYFNESVKRLQNWLSKRTGEVKITPTPIQEQSVVAKQIEQLKNRRAPNQKELDAEALFLQALRWLVVPNHRHAITGFTEAIQLNPTYLEAFSARGASHVH